MKRKTYQAEGTTVAGPYSQAVEMDGWVYFSGQTPMDFETGKLVQGDMGIQTSKCFENLKRVMDAASIQWDDVAKVTVFLTDMADFQAMNAVYAAIFSSPFPARTTIAVAALPLGAQIEIDMVAKR